MRTSLTFGKISGIPLKVHINWFITAGLVTWSLARGYFPQQHPGWETSSYWLTGFLTALLFFGSVLLHELGHALVALQEGVPVKSITLFIFGGIAHIANEPPTAKSEFRIVVAGPFSSFVLASVFGLIAIFPGLSSLVRGTAYYLSGVNILLGVFNLLPGFPLDGGRILRALFWSWKGDFRQATRWATHAGLMVALLFLLGGLLIILNGHMFNGLWMAFISLYLGSAARDGYRQAEIFDPAVDDAQIASRIDSTGLPHAQRRLIAALFPNLDDAESALTGLRKAGFSVEDISVLARENVFSSRVGRLTFPAEQAVGVGALIIPLPNALVGSGVLAFHMEAAAGSPERDSLALGLELMGFPTVYAREASESINSGKIMVSVHTEDAKTHLAREILASTGAAPFPPIDQDLDEHSGLRPLEDGGGTTLETVWADRTFKKE